MAALSMTGFDHALKTMYSERKVLSLIFKDNPFLAKVAKNMKFGGRTKNLDVVYSPGAGEGAVFSTAQANVGGAKGKQFAITRKNSYALRQIDNEVIEASEIDEGVLLKALKLEGDSAIQQLNNSLGGAMFQDGSGKIGEITINVSYPASGDEALLATTDDVVNFYEDQKLVVAASTAATPRAGTLTISKRNEVTGVLTMSADLNDVSDGIPAITTGDSIFTEGRYVAASDKLNLVGLGGWIPATAPTAGDSFFGVDRSADPTRLAGYRFTNTGSYSGYNTIDAVKLLCRMIGRAGFTPDTAFMSHERLDGLIAVLGAKVQYNKQVVPIHNAKGKLIAEVGFDAVRVHTPSGVVDCIADRSCPNATVFVLKMDVWSLWSLGQTVKWISDVSGAKTRTRESADGVELRLVSRSNLTCCAPGCNGRFDWS